MKTYSIGRDDDNDIIFDGNTDRRNLYISGHHAVLKVTLFSKYFINDISTNGTTVNGARIGKNQDVEVKRGDNVKFGNVGELDWSMIERPRGPLYVAIVVAIMLLIILFAVNNSGNKGSNTSTPVKDSASASSVIKRKKENKDFAKDSKNYQYEGNNNKEDALRNKVDDGASVNDWQPGTEDGNTLDKYFKRPKPSPSRTQVRQPVKERAKGSQKTSTKKLEQKEEPKEVEEKGNNTEKNNKELREKAKGRLC